MTRQTVTTRIIRAGQRVPPDVDWLAASPEERIAAVWTLTLLCYAWRREGPGEPRLDRSVGHIQRAGR